MDRLETKHGESFDKQYGWAQPEVKRLVGEDAKVHLAQPRQDRRSIVARTWTASDRP